MLSMRSRGSSLRNAEKKTPGSALARGRYPSAGATPSETVKLWNDLFGQGHLGGCFQLGCSSALLGFPVRLVESLLYISDALLHLAFDLLGGTLNLLVRVASQFANLALNLSGHVFCSALYLIAVHDSALYVCGEARFGSILLT